jgi:hypothetical protein
MDWGRSLFLRYCIIFDFCRIWFRKFWRRELNSLFKSPVHLRVSGLCHWGVSHHKCRCSPSLYSILNTPFSILHSQYSILNTPFSILHSPYSRNQIAREVKSSARSSRRELRLSDSLGRKARRDERHQHVAINPQGCIRGDTLWGLQQLQIASASKRSVHIR